MYMFIVLNGLLKCFASFQMRGHFTPKRPMKKVAPRSMMALQIRMVNKKNTQ